MTAGWQTKPIGEAFRVVNGGTPKTGVATYWDGQHHWITPAEMGGLSSPYLSQSRRRLTDEGLRVGAELVPANSIILSTRAPIGHLVINDVPMAFNQGCKGLVPLIGINPKFAYYFLLANVPLLESLGTGATFKELSGGKLKEVPFCFPVLAEQRRIVAILDEAFEGMATAKANAEKNLQNAREVYESEVQSTFARIALRWEAKPLATVCEVKDGTHDSPKYVTDGIPFVTQKNIRATGLSFADTKFISKDDHANYYRRSNVALGDILISMIGANRGMACLVDDDRIFSIKNVGLVKASKGVNPQFLLAFLKSATAARYVQAGSKGGAQSFIGLTELRAFPVPVPPLGEQAAVAAALGALSGETERLQTIYERKLAALDELKRSLLHEAFMGALTAKTTDEQLEAVA